MNIHRIIVAILGCVSLCAAAAFAEDEPAKRTAAGEAKAAFEAADYDGNGKVSFEEFRNRAALVFPHLDANDDGRIAGREHLAAVDASGNAVKPGDVTVHDYHAALRQYFKDADKNKDGSLDLPEWAGTAGK